MIVATPIPELTLVTNRDGLPPLHNDEPEFYEFQHLWNVDVGLGEEVRVTFKAVNRDRFEYSIFHDGDELIWRELLHAGYHMTERRMEIDIGEVFDLFDLGIDGARNERVMTWMKDAVAICDTRGQQGRADSDVVLTFR